MVRARPPQEPPGSVALFARCVRGTEWVAAAELAGRLGARAVATGHREVRFRLPGALAPALDLRTVDDVFLHVASLDGIDHTRASLGVLAGAAGTLDARDAVERVRALRRTAGPLAM
ncbi:MAG TPA: hypothetical protein VEP73_09835, partial [Actinomycetota bacterium]|nr:hypothetical protein [Actinomycetota bacterium]